MSRLIDYPSLIFALKKIYAKSLIDLREPLKMPLQTAVTVQKRQSLFEL